MLYNIHSSNRVLHAHSWAVLEAHMLPIIQKIIFPIMQYGEEDEDLYQNDQVDYIRKMFGKCEDLTKNVKATHFSSSACSCANFRFRVFVSEMQISFGPSVSIDTFTGNHTV